MHILYVSQYFPPEMGAPAARLHELSRDWVRAGHQVTVLTGFPNHPAGRVPEPYRRHLRRGTFRERTDGIDVVRTWLYTAPNRFPAERILNYVSFFVSAMLRGIWLQRPDVVIGTSPQLLVGLAALVLARRFRCRFVFEVRDLWPESLPASGISHIGSSLYRALNRMAGFLYRSADLVVPVSEPFRATIAAHAPRAKIVAVENGVDTMLFQPNGEPGEVKEGLGLQGRFVVSYIGTIGFAHGLDTVLQAASVLKERSPDLLFLFVGDGAERETLEAKGRAMALTNVRFVGERPRAEIPRYIAASDVCLVLLRRSDVFEKVLPSKMLEFMACARPLVVGVSGLARALVEESNGGICVTPEDYKELAEAVHRFRAEPNLGLKLGENGRRFVLDRFMRGAKARAYLSALHDVVGV